MTVNRAAAEIGAGGGGPLGGSLDGARVALIGPLPPEMGGTTPGGVATHQAHLAAGLVEHGVAAYLLATNVRSDGRDGWQRSGVPLTRGGHELQTEALAADLAPGRGSRLSRIGGRSPARGVCMQPMSPLRLGDPRYLGTVGLGPLARYTFHVAGARTAGSRRELLEQLLWYRAFLWSVRPALIHVQHPLERQRIVRSVLALERRRVPVVVTAHSFFGEHPEALVWGLMASNVRAADRVIAVSPHIAEQAIQLGAPAGRVRVIRSGVDVERFRVRDRLAARAALGVAPDRRLVLFVGNLEPRKQVDVLLHALARLADVEVVVVGTGASAGADDQTVALHTLTRELGLVDRVRFVGHVPAERLLDWYAAADVFALPSSSEAQGIVALEAMACGLPVVASAVGGLLGTIQDGETGYLVPAGDVAALAERLSAMLTDAPLRAKIGAAARAAVERDFSWSRAVRATIEVYAEVLGESR